VNPQVAAEDPILLPARGSVAALFFVGFCLIASPWGAEAADEAGGVEFFEREVRPVLVERCLECHSSSGKRKGGLALDSRDGWMTGGDSGSVITPGDPEKSLLIEVVRYHNRELQMPPDNRLPDRQLAALESWVRQGAPDPRIGPPQQEAPRGMSEEEGRGFWSFRPIGSPDLPAATAGDWIVNPIDSFILAALQKKGLSPAPKADRASLLRRVTFDLTGLPPEPTDLDLFLGDTAPGAWDRAIDRLLASPQYGVRWGRHWLDVARYADSNGLDENLGFGQAWRYRDYVIDSFNTGKPFDRFVVEQLAGDLLPGATAEQKTATGFLALGARVLAEPDEEKLRMDVIDEQLDTLGKAFLGMTFGCARCHDHKFDPITQRDYYGMAAIFRSSENFASSKTGVIKHWYEHSLATPEELAKAKADDGRIEKARGEFSSFKAREVSRLQSRARAQVVEYLVAASAMSPEATLAQAEPLCAEAGLHPWILLQCRLHLSYHPEDPLFQPWHELAAKGDREGIRRHYGPLFAAVDSAWQTAQKANPKVVKLDDPGLEMARAALHDSEGLLALPTEPFKAFEPGTVRELARLEEKVRQLESTAYDPPSVMGVAEAAKVVAQMPIHIRGNHLAHGAMVNRAVPAVMRGPAGEPGWKPDRSGRLELAKWLVQPDHPLTARVMVNRIWRWHFGSGLVFTTDNFGVKGEAPSHPELLDWLARRFIESGWDVKAMHRLLLQSNTYQMASVHPAPGQAPLVDPENRLHWKFQRQRLEAEQIRDALLFASGSLDPSLGGKTLPLRNRQMVFNHTSKDHTTYGDRRRSAYLPVIRNHVADALAQFDYPDPTMPTGSRNSTVVAPQCLYMMNSPLVFEASRTMASASLEAGTSPQARIEWMYRRALSRPPTESESVEGLRWVREFGEAAGWPLLCQALMASNEFVYLP
jgi:mono/diheme cytochrome c family protein